MRDYVFNEKREFNTCLKLCTHSYNINQFNKKKGKSNNLKFRNRISKMINIRPQTPQEFLIPKANSFLRILHNTLQK